MRSGWFNDCTGAPGLSQVGQDGQSGLLVRSRIPYIPTMSEQQQQHQQQQRQQQRHGERHKRKRSTKDNRGKSAGYQRKRARKGFSKPTGTRPAFSRSKSRGAKQVTLEAHLLSRLKYIHDKWPEHPMFAPVRQGLCCAPYIVRRKDGQEHQAKISWRKLCRNIARRARAAGVSTLAEAKAGCWMVKSPQISFNCSEGGESHCFRRVLVVRVLSFLKQEPPNQQWWEWLNGGGLEKPFDHFCGRGQPRPGQEGKVCINGLYHGRIASRADNEDRKKCTNGALALCPGHGGRSGSGKCIFTHPDGEPQPCRNHPTQVGPCDCTRRCF